MFEMLHEIKLFKGIKDNIQDNLLQLIIKESQQRILAHINSRRKEHLEEIPDALDFVVRDVSIFRFNKIDAEGTDKNSQEGISLDWKKSYLDEYEGLFSQYYDEIDKSKQGSFTFY